MITVTGFMAIVGGGTALGGLLIGSSAHLARPSILPAALHRHAVLPTSTVALAAIGITAIEIGLGVAGVIALVVGFTETLAIILWATAALFTCYAGYARHVTARRDGGPCGCSHSEVPMDDWITARAIAFAVCAAAGALTAGALPTGTSQWTITVLATAALTLTLWQLPAAMRHINPTGATAWTS